MELCGVWERSIISLSLFLIELLLSLWLECGEQELVCDSDKLVGDAIHISLLLRLVVILDGGDLGRVSASKDATLKLLMRVVTDFISWGWCWCCEVGGGTVGLVIAIRNGVTVIPGDFSMYNCTLIIAIVIATHLIIHKNLFL